MSENIFAQLFDFGALGIFAGFLIWQHLGMQKRLDAMVEGFQEQLREIETRHETRVEVMRERYDLVINKVRAEGAAQLRECLTSRDVVISKVGSQVADNSVVMAQLQVQVQDNSSALAHALVKQDTALSKLDEGLTEMRLRREVQRLKDDR